MIEGLNIIKPKFENDELVLDKEFPGNIKKLEELLILFPDTYIAGTFVFGTFIYYLYSSESEAEYWISTGHTFRLWYLIHPAIK